MRTLEIHVERDVKRYDSNVTHRPLMPQSSFNPMRDVVNSQPNVAVVVAIQTNACIQLISVLCVLCYVCYRLCRGFIYSVVWVAAVVVLVPWSQCNDRVQSGIRFVCKKQTNVSVYERFHLMLML